MTVTDLAELLATEAGEDYSDASVSDQFQKWVKEAYVRIVSLARFLWQRNQYSVATVASTAEYTLDAAVAEVLSVQDTSNSNVKVGYNPPETLVDLGYDLDSEDAPTSWYWSGINATTTALKIRLYPVPDDAYTLIVYTLDRPSTLGTSDVVPVPEDFLELVKDFVRAMVLFNTDQLDLYAGAITRFDQLLMVLVQRYIQPRRAQSRLKARQLPRIGQAPAASQD